jgi:hypothetical protein
MLRRDFHLITTNRAALSPFDVTPPRYVTALITERGVCAPNEAALRAMFPEAEHFSRDERSFQFRDEATSANSVRWWCRRGSVCRGFVQSSTKIGDSWPLAAELCLHQQIRRASIQSFHSVTHVSFSPGAPYFIIGEGARAIDSSTIA